MWGRSAACLHGYVHSERCLEKSETHSRPAFQTPHHWGRNRPSSGSRCCQVPSTMWTFAGKTDQRIIRSHAATGLFSPQSLLGAILQKLFILMPAIFKQYFATGRTRAATQNTLLVSKRVCICMCRPKVRSACRLPNASASPEPPPSLSCAMTQMKTSHAKPTSSSGACNVGLDHWSPATERLQEVNQLSRHLRTHLRPESYTM